MPLGFFRVVGDFTGIVRRSSLEDNPDPFEQAVTGLATFTPSIDTVTSEQDAKTYLLRPILGRIVDGALMTINRIPLDTDIPEELPGDPANHLRYGIRLVANTNALGPLKALDYRVTFSRMVWDHAERKLNPFTFSAPNEEGGDIDLATVVKTNRRVAGVR